MLSKNNRKLQERKLQEKQRFGFRKYSFGLASALIGVSFMLGTGSTVSADTTTPAENVAAATTSNADSGTTSMDTTKSEATDTKSADATASTTATETKTDTTEASNTASDSSATTDANSTSAATDNSDTKAENTTASDTAKTASTESASGESKNATTDASAEKATDSAAQATTDISVEKLTDSAALTADALKASAVATTTDADSTTTATDDAASAEGKITDEGKAKGLTDSDVDPEMSDANGASLVADNSNIPSGYKADPTEGRYTFGIVNLGPEIPEGSNSTTYNKKFGTNYYLRLSTDAEKFDETAYVQVVDANSDSIVWEKSINPGETVDITPLKNEETSSRVKENGKAIDYYTAVYEKIVSSGLLMSQSISINTNYAGRIINKAYEAGTNASGEVPTSVGFNYPIKSTSTTQYIARDAAGNETILAEYDVTGRLSYSYTSSNARAIKGYDLVEEPTVKSGTLSRSYSIGDEFVRGTGSVSDTLQSARVYIITDTDGSAKVEIRVASKAADTSTIDDESIWKTVFTSENLKPGSWSTTGNNAVAVDQGNGVLVDEDGHGFVVRKADLEKLGYSGADLANADVGTNVINWYLKNGFSAGQEPAKYYYAPQGQVRINYVTSDGTVIQAPVSAYENSGANTSFDVTGSTYQPQTITANGKTYRYVKSDKSMGTAGTTEVNGYTYNVTPSDATGTIKSATVNDVYYVYEQVTFHTEAESKDVTRTIEYYDSVTGEPIPSNLESTVTQTATLNRNKIVDDQNNVIGYGTVSADGSSYTINASWQVEAQTWTEQKSADLSDYGYTAPDRASVAAVMVDGNTTNVTEKVYYGHQTVPVTPENPGTPGEPINPNDPNSPVYGEETDRKNLVKDATQTIHYVGAGDKTPADNVVTQKDAFTRTVTIDKVTGKVLSYTDWIGEKTFNTVDTPVVQGYHADKKIAGGLTATVDNPDVEETVTYSPNGKIVPVDPNGTPIPGADTPTYPTDPNDPTKVVPNEPIPDVPNYTPVDPSPVTPADPGKDTPVPYNQVVTGTIKYVDDTTGKTLSSEDLEKGTVGSKINYTTVDKIKGYEDKGYQLVSTDFSDGKEVYAKEGNDFVVHLKHSTKEVVSYKDATQTIHYVGAGDKTPANKVQTQKDAFTKTDTIDKVTGEVVKTTGWEGTKTFGTEDTPVVQGYHADKKTAGGLTATVDNPDVEETVTYSPNGKLVPVDPNGTIPGADTPTYPTDPNDPTKVVPNEPIPDVPGYTPVDPSPVTPTNPGEDTPVPYTKNETPEVKYGLTEKFVDENGNELLPSVNKGTDYKTGDSYDVTKDAKVITGYVLVKTTDVTGTFTDSDKTAVFTYKKIGKIVPVDPDGNPIPGADTPTYKNDPDDPSKVVPNEPTPDVPGYKTDIPKVTPEDPTKDTPVPYKQVVKGTIKYVDDTTGATLSSEELAEATVGSKINYTTADKIKSYEDKGYQLVSTDFSDGKEVYAKEGNDFVVHLKHSTKEVVSYKDATQTIHYVGAGDKTPANKVQTQKDAFTKTDTIDKVTGEVVKTTGWEGTKTFGTEDTPVVQGYHADKKTAGGLTATPENPDVEETVTYSPNGKLVPVDPNGTPIPGADTPTYPTDPNDPTKVVPNEPIPDVPNWTPVDPSPVTPSNPGEDTPVPYTKNETPAAKYGLTEKFVDEEGNELLPSVNKGTDYKTGDSYDVTKDAKVVEGYVLVKTTDTTGTFTDSDKTAVFTYKKIGKIVPVDPNGNPIPGADTPTYKNDPDDPSKVVPNEPTPDVPGYKTDVPKVTPEDPTKDTPVPYTKNETPAAKYGLTEKFVDEDGNELSPSVNKGTDYKTGDKYDVTKDAKVITGYVLVKTTDTTGTFDKSDKTAVFTYKKIGKIVPVDPSGNPIPGADTPTYKNDPDDPSKVVPNEPTPDVPGYKTDVPKVTPEDPTKDTPVPYTKNETPAAKYGLTEKFVDEDGNELLPSVNKGTDYKTGDSYDVTKDAKVVEGYVLVKTTDTTGTFTDGNKTAVFTYKKIGKIVPVDPNGNPIPGADTPTYKNDPDDPSKVVPNEPTPSVPGYKTDVPNVTPEDPTKDTPVPYTKNTTPSTPEVPSTPETPSTPEVPSTPETPSNPEVPSTPETPSNPEEPSTPETPSNPEEPTTPDTPEVPSQPQEPASPSGQNNPQVPSQPAKPATPKQTTFAPNSGKKTPAQGKTATASQLPQTGADEEKASLLSAVGLGVIALTSLFGLLGGKKRKH